MSPNPLDHIAAAHQRAFGTPRAAVTSSAGNPALREQLIDAAERLLADRQVSAITTRDIARAAGLSVGVLYNYFGDKNDLVVAALLRRYDAQLAVFGEGLPVAGEGDVEANLVRYAEAMFGLAAGTLPSVAGLMSDPALMHRFVAEIHGPEYGLQRTLGQVAAYLAAEQALGRLGEFDVPSAVTAFAGSMIALGLQGMVGGQGVMDDAAPDEARAQIPRIVRTLVGGLGA
jgi:AcrR family transcriptional regulator